MRVLAVIASVVFALLLTEASYRIYLFSKQPYRFRGDRNVWYFQQSPFRYNEEFGYEYVPGEVSGGAIYDGRVIQCWDPVSDWVINERGNSGSIKGSYDTAEIKILVFGDSVTQRPRRAPNGEMMTWPNYLQDLLEEELGKSVHVVNFGRDAYGVLQMLDLASVRIAEWKPDLAILAFVTDDLTRDRFWRTVVRQNGQERVMVSAVPNPHPSWDTATDAFLLNSQATKEWCQTMLASQRKDDPIVAELEQALVDGQRRSSLLADPLSTSHSFVLDSLIHSDPFHSTYHRTGPSQMPRHTLTDFEDDERAAKKMAEIRSTGVPIVLVHLATYKELAEGEEYLGAGGERHRALVDSLERLAGREVYETLDHAARPIEDLNEIPVNVESDHHPSLKGHRFYARVVAEILLRHGFAGAH